jgi:hypothetical protein
MSAISHHMTFFCMRTEFAQTPNREWTLCGSWVVDVFPTQKHTARSPSFSVTSGISLCLTFVHPCGFAGSCVSLAVVFAGLTTDYPKDLDASLIVGGSRCLGAPRPHVAYPKTSLRSYATRTGLGRRGIRLAVPLHTSYMWDAARINVNGLRYEGC